MKRLGLGVAAASLLAASACSGERAHVLVQGDGPGRLSVSATGEVSAAPDMASVRAGVVAQAPTAEAAMADQRERMAAVFAALTEAGIAQADIQTSNLDLSPVYAPFERGQQERAIIGYRASNQVTAIARDLTAVGPTLDALVTAGANTISGVTFGFEDSSALLDQAREEAILTVMSRARLYAETGGFRLGRILEMREGGAAPIAREMVLGRTAMAEAVPTPIAAGELDLSVTVTATFEIGQSRR